MGSVGSMDDTNSYLQDVAPSRRTVLQLLGTTAGLTTLGATDALAATSDSSNADASNMGRVTKRSRVE